MFLTLTIHASGSIWVCVCVCLCVNTGPPPFATLWNNFLPFKLSGLSQSHRIFGKYMIVCSKLQPRLDTHTHNTCIYNIFIWRCALLSSSCSPLYRSLNTSLTNCAAHIELYLARKHTTIVFRSLLPGCDGKGKLDPWYLLKQTKLIWFRQLRFPKTRA